MTDPTVFLGAIARFLGADVLPAIDDPATRFRVRIAAHTLGGLAREQAGGRELAHAELLALGATPPSDTADLTTALRAARLEAVERIRDPATAPEDLERLRKALLRTEAAAAQMGQPRFDPSLHIEDP